MKKLLTIVCVSCLGVVTAQGQSQVAVGYQKTLQLPVPGATAAYSLDGDGGIVEASAANGVVAIAGKRPGSTHIVVVTAAGIQTFAVTVPVAANTGQSLPVAGNINTLTAGNCAVWSFSRANTTWYRIR